MRISCLEFAFSPGLGVLEHEAGRVLGKPSNYRYGTADQFCWVLGTAGLDFFWTVPVLTQEHKL